jgi:regulator of replication initiation timing
MSAKGSGISKDDVRKAYLEAKTVKVKPTIVDIMNILGRGSKSTIHTYMEEIRREELNATINSESSDSYAPVVEAVAVLIAESRRRAVSALEDRVNTLESDNRELKIEIDEVTERRDALAIELKKLDEIKTLSEVEAEIHRKRCEAYMELNKQQYGDLMFVKGRLEQMQTDDDIHKDLKGLIDTMTAIASRKPQEADLGTPPAEISEGNVESASVQHAGAEVNGGLRDKKGRDKAPK